LTGLTFIRAGVIETNPDRAVLVDKAGGICDAGFAFASTTVFGGFEAINDAIVTGR
jgi:hypothetical protein